ncbi:MAG: hypothetical protein CVT48_00785 [Thermoplasmata archaeon HGW-Thermoplasmata-1]|nr:MAG: hypothetical protein CVT48_00785 [Thermoplasmata archaeon HGW-Thermoplasmata-1]
MAILEKLKDHWQKPLYRNSYYLMGNSVVGAGMGFLFWMVAARYYDSGDMGLAIGLISAAGLLTSVSRLGLDASIVRFLDKERDKKGFINTCLTVVGAATLLLACIYLLGLNIWGSKLLFVRENPLYVVAFIVFTGIYGVLPILNNVYVAMRDTKYTFLQNTIFSAGKIPLPIIMAPLFSIFGIFGSWGIALTAAVLVGLFVFTRKVVPGYVPYPTFKKEMARDVFGFSAGNYVASLLAGAPALALPLIILHFLTPAENAYYYVAFAVAGMIFIIPGAFSTSLFAEGAAREERFLQNLKKAMKHTYLLLIPAVAVVAIFGKWALRLFGAEYSESGHILLALLSLSGLFMGATSFYGTYLRIKIRIREMVVVSLLTCIGLIGIPVALLSLTNLGIISVGFAYLMVYAAFCAYVVARFLAIAVRAKRNAKAGSA